MKMSNEMYDKIKWVVMIFMPALTALVGTVGKIYGWEYTEIATATISAITVFLGAITVKSSNDFKKED